MAGERGPIPISAAERRRRGTRAKPGRAAAGDAVPVETPPRPSILAGEARREWVRVTKELRRQRRLAKTDRAALTAYCLAWGRLLEVEAQLATDGYTADGSKGQPVVSPAFVVWSDLVRRVESLSKALGLHVAARVRLPAAPEEPIEDDGLGAMIDGIRDRAR